jgi:dolichol-phosphate mannosyltransferase
VVFSFFNEEDIIPELLVRMRGVLQKEMQNGNLGDYELVFVNDASTDSSREILTAESESRGDIRLVNMSRNFGVSACVLAGMEHAAGDLIVYMDADLQDPPEVIPRMLESWRSEPNVEVVHTVRTSRLGETAFKLALTKLGYWILQQVSTVDLQIEAGDFKMLSRRALNHLIALREKNPYLRGLVCWIGFRQTSVRYEREARFSGETKFPVLSPKVIRNFLSSALISFSDIPLQFSSLFGVLVSFASFIYALALAVYTVLGRNIAPFYWVAAVLMFLGGLQLLTIGMLGLYVGSIYVESKRRPNYIVESLVGFNSARPVVQAPPMIQESGRT